MHPLWYHSAAHLFSLTLLCCLLSFPSLVCLLLKITIGCFHLRPRFVEQNIVILRDDRQHPDWYPTRMNIYRAIQWLMSGQQPGHSLFFHFSGHGSQQVRLGLCRTQMNSLQSSCMQAGTRMASTAVLDAVIVKLHTTPSAHMMCHGMCITRYVSPTVPFLPLFLLA